MATTPLPFLLVLTLFAGEFSVGAQASQVPVWSRDVTVSEIRDGKVYFSGGEGKPSPEAVEVSAHSLEYFGILHPKEVGGVPYVLLSGLKCEGCQDQRVLYLVRGDGKDLNSFVFPGKIRDKRNRLIFEGRAFYGQCIPGRGDVYVSFQKDKADRRRYLQTSVFVAEVGENRLFEKVIIRRRERPKLRTVKRRVKKELCTEIKGYERRSITYRLAP